VYCGEVYVGTVMCMFCIDTDVFAAGAVQFDIVWATTERENLIN